MQFATRPEKGTAYRLGAAALLVAAAAILTALGFEHLGGYSPCPLCLQQRYAYYAGVPALFVALVLLSGGRPNLAAGVFILVGLGFLANAVLGTYHAGVEWRLWAGPDTCAAPAVSKPLGSGSGGVLEQLATARVIRCDEAPWHFLGLSFAGWNVVASLLLAGATASSALKAWRSRG